MEVGNYSIGQTIWETPGSIIREAVNSSTSQKVVCKICKTNGVENESEKENLSRRISFEIDSMRSVTSPYVMKLYDVQEGKEGYYLFMPYALGGDLLEFINRNGAINENYSSKVAFQVLSGLKALHDIGYGHRDIKPENILFMDNDPEYPTVCVADLGLAFSLKDEKDFLDLGTVSYMAPEVKKRQPYNESCDIYSFGVTLYAMVTASLPEFLENNELNFPEPTDNQYFVPLSEELKDLISSMLQEDPQNRISTDDALNHPWVQRGNQIPSQKQQATTMSYIYPDIPLDDNSEDELVF